MQPISRTVIAATAVAGTLDIGWAFLMAERSPPQVLRSVASGPFGAAANDWGWAGSILGLFVHLAIMAVMVALFLLAARKWPGLNRRPLVAGPAYGLLLYLVMYWIVLPLRWPDVFPVTDPVEVAMALFAHVVLVGLPIALIAARFQRRRPA